MPQTPGSEDLRRKPTGAVVDEVMQQSQQVLETGARVTAELNELRRRADEAMDWRKQLRRHPWVPLGAALGAAVLLYLAISRIRGK